MAIVTLQIPRSVEHVAYGRAKLQADQTGALQVPGYVAKTLLGLAGVTGPALADSAATLLAATVDDYEANYLFWAYGQPLPDSNRIAAASALLTANGEPVASLA